MPPDNLILWYPLVLLTSNVQNLGLFQCVISLHLVTKLLELQHQPFQWIFKIDFFYDWLVWAPCCPRTPQESFPGPKFESIYFSVLNLLYGPILTSMHNYWKNHSFVYKDLGSHVMSLLFNTLSRFAIVFLLRSKCFLISWLQSPSTVNLEYKKIKFVPVSIFFPISLPRSDGTGGHDLHYLIVKF